MKLWPFKRKDPPLQPEWMDCTPIANMVAAMAREGRTLDDIIWNVRAVELWHEVQAHIPQVITVNPDMVPKPARVTKPRSHVTKRPRNRVTTNPRRRDRAKYMRDYRANRAKIRVATRDGVVTPDGGAA